MDTLPKLTGRQRRRSLRFGFPRAVRFVLAAAAALIVFGFLLGLSFAAHAIGVVDAAAGAPVKQYAWTYNDQRTPFAHHSGFGSSSGQACSGAMQARDADGTYVSGNGFDTYVRQSTLVSSTESSTDWSCQTSEKNTHTFTGGNCCGGPAPTTAPNSFGGAIGLVAGPQQCPANAALAGPACYCAGGYRPPSSGPQTTCVAYTCESKPFVDRSAGPFTKNPTPSGPQAIEHFCDTNSNVANSNYGCNINETMYMAKQGADGRWWALYTSGYDARTCQPGSQKDPAAPSSGQAPDATASSAGRGSDQTPANATTCPANQCPGTVNGASVCAACSRSVGSDSSSSNPADSAASGAGAGAQTIVQRKVDCVGDLCSISSTTTVGGTITSTTTETTNRTAYCSASPKDPQCAGSSGSGGSGSGTGGDGSGAAFGGSCAGGWTCSGDSDAVTCAIATEQHVRDCQFVTNFGDGSTSAMSDKGVAMTTAGDLGDSDHPRRVANVGGGPIGSFDQTDLLAGSCPGDRTVATVMGHAVVLPFSKLCGSAVLLGNVLVGFAALACVFIVFGVNRS